MARVCMEMWNTYFQGIPGEHNMFMIMKQPFREEYYFQLTHK